MVELAVRIFLPYNSPDTVRENTLRYRPAVFAVHMLKSNQDVEVEKAWGNKPSSSISASRFEINERGYRGRSFEIDKPDRHCRIVVMGGSAVFDPRAEEGHDWPHLIESYLRQAGVQNVDVLNAGVPGHASFDSVGKLLSQVWMFEPDYVLFYNAWNDIKYWTELSPEDSLLEVLEPYDPRQDPFRSYRNGLDRLLSRSQIYVKLRTKYFIWTADVGTEGRTSSEELSDSYSRVGPRQYRLGVEMFVEAARTIGATPVLLTQATLVNESNTPEELERISFNYAELTHEALIRAFSECNEIVRSVALEKDVDLFDVAKTFSGDRSILADHVHLSTEGSPALAEAIASFLIDRLAVCE